MLSLLISLAFLVFKYLFFYALFCVLRRSSLPYSFLYALEAPTKVNTQALPLPPIKSYQDYNGKYAYYLDTYVVTPMCLNNRHIA